MKRVIRLFPKPRPGLRVFQNLECCERSPAGEAIVRLHLDSPADLLMPFEAFPANFGHELAAETGPVLNLNKDFVDYLFARLSEFGDESLLLRLKLGRHPNPKSDTSVSVAAIRTAIQRYFAHVENLRRQNLLQLVWNAALLGLLGGGALVLSVFLEAYNTATEPGIGQLLLSQGITVFGWLTFWEALANALWNWKPLYQQLRMCQRLQRATLELEFA